MADFKIDYDKHEPNNTLVTVSVVLTTIFIIGVFIFCYYLFIAMVSQDFNEKQDLVKYDKINQLNMTQLKELNSIHWVDKAKGIVKIPINDAFNIVVKKYN